MGAIYLRGVSYTLLAIAMAQLAYFEAVTLSHMERFAELGYIELSHAVLLTLCAVIMAVTAWRIPAYRTLAVFLSLAFAILTVRENDQILEMWLPHGVWKWPALALFLGIVWILVRKRQELFAQMREVGSTLPAGILLAGFTTMVFSRFFGRTSFWEAVMEDRYLRVAKNAAEESVELFGIGLFAAGVVELALLMRARAS